MSYIRSVLSPYVCAPWLLLCCQAPGRSEWNEVQNATRVVSVPHVGWLCTYLREKLSRPCRAAERSLFVSCYWVIGVSSQARVKTDLVAVGDDASLARPFRMPFTSSTAALESPSPSGEECSGSL